MEIELRDDNFKEDILESPIPALVDFWSPWCGPCRMMEPVIEEISKEYQGKLKVGKLNVDEALRTASEFGIMSIPTLMIFKQGKVVDTMIGVMKKSALEERIKPHLR
ncbi:MAG: thioredoxin [Candidatus Hydrogenedentota bacterium]